MKISTTKNLFVKKMLFVSILSAITLIISACVGLKDAEVEGNIISASGGGGIVGATVRTGNVSTTSSSGGYFIIQAAIGDGTSSITLEVSKTGYNSTNYSVRSFKEKDEVFVPVEEPIRIILKPL